MEIRLFCMLHYLGAWPEAIEYGQLELKDYQSVALVFAPKIFTIWVCEAVLEFMECGETIIGLIYKNFETVFMVYFLTDFFEWI